MEVCDILVRKEKKTLPEIKVWAGKHASQSMI